MLELIRRYAWSDEKRSLLYKYFDLKPNHIVVDVGCGTGAFSRVLAQRLDAKKGGRLVGIDRNGELLDAARKFAKIAHQEKIISFKKGNVVKAIPLPNDYADRVVCQAFLWLTTNEEKEKAIKEMIRVCKPGGLIGAVEGGVDTSVIFIENNERLNKLYSKQKSAMIKGYKIIHEYDRTIGYKLPIVFKKLGLERVRLDGIAHTYLWSDDRIPLDYRREQILDSIRYPADFLSKLEKLGTKLQKQRFVEKMEPSLLAGGMTYKEIIEYNHQRKLYYNNFLNDPNILKKDMSVDAGISFITTAIKP